LGKYKDQGRLSIVESLGYTQGSCIMESPYSLQRQHNFQAVDQSQKHFK
jgi:hypothetical protein